MGHTPSMESKRMHPYVDLLMKKPNFKLPSLPDDEVLLSKETIQVLQSEPKPHRHQRWTTALEGIQRKW